LGHLSHLSTLKVNVTKDPKYLPRRDKINGLRGVTLSCRLIIGHYEILSFPFEVGDLDQKYVIFDA